MRRRNGSPGFLGRALLVSCVLSVSSIAAAAPSAGDLIVRDGPAGGEAGAGGARAAAAVSGEVVRVDAAVLAAEPEELWLELVPGEGLRAYLVEAEHRPGGGLVWRGGFASDEPDHVSVTLTLHGGEVTGTLQPPEGPAYRLLPRADGTAELTTFAGDDLPCGVSPEETVPLAAEPTGVSAGRTAAAAAAAAAREVSILVVYTPRVGSQHGRGRVESAARHNVDLMNTSFRNSGIDGRASLAAAVELDLGIEGKLDSGGALGRILDHPGSHELQDRWQADIVSGVLHSRELGGVCGVANAMFKGNAGQLADRAYNVVVDGCFMFSGRTFIHEAGHNLGAHHDPAHGPPVSSVLFPYAFGHGVDGRFRTVMAYPGACDDCTSLDIFSNPKRSIGGEPTGIAGKRDNALTLNQTFPLVASFRTGRPEPPSVPRPAAPDGLAAAAVSPTDVALAWTDNAGDETGYEVEVLAEGGAAGWQRAAQLPADTTAHVVDCLDPETAYRFRVRATGSGPPSGYSDEAAVTTPSALPAAPAGVAAEPLTAVALRLAWEEVDRATGYEVEVRSADPAADRAAEPVVLGADGAVLGGLAAATPYTLRVRAVNAAGASGWSAPASATTLGAGGPCEAGADTLCLLGGRFEVRAQWRNPRSPFGHGLAAARPAPGSERTGLFTFFDPDNVELVVKMLDGRAANGAFWHFYGALSDLEYWVTVRDTAEGGSRTYHNEPFELCGRGDTTAFVEGPEAPAGGSLAAPSAVPVAAAAGSGTPAALAAPPSRATAAAEGACTPDEDSLCLAGGRFRVEVAWENPRVAGSAGTGKVFAGLDGDQSGHFWFFRPDNLELSVKILDGRALNGHFWIFWGGLSDVGYTIHVTDTETGVPHELVNPPLTLCGGAVNDVL